MDLLFDTVVDETSKQRTAPLSASRITTSETDESSFEEEMLSVAELAYSLYSLHGHAQPLELMRILSSVDNSFLSEKKHDTIESYALDQILGIFF